MSGVVFMGAANGTENLYYYDAANGKTYEIGDATEGYVSGETTPSTFTGGSTILSDNGFVLFQGVGQNGSYDLFIYSEAKNKWYDYVSSDVNGADSQIFAPEDFVAGPNNSVYFAGTNSSQEQTLWTINPGSTAPDSGLHQIADSPEVNGQLAVMGGDVFFNGDAPNGSNNELMEYNPGGSGASAFTVITGGSGSPLDPIDTTVVTLNNGSKSSTQIFFKDGANDNDLYEYTQGGGSSSASFLMYNGDPRDITSATFSSGGHNETAAFFVGSDHTGQGRGLFEITINSSGQDQVSEVVNASTGNAEARGGNNGANPAISSLGLDPQDLTVMNGLVYFAGADNPSPSSTFVPWTSNNPEGLWVYDPANGKVQELLSGSDYNLNVNNPIDLGQTPNPLPQMTESGGVLYFSADHGNTVDALFTLTTGSSWNQVNVSAHIGGTSNTIPIGLTGL